MKRLLFIYCSLVFCNTIAAQDTLLPPPPNEAALESLANAEYITQSFTGELTIEQCKLAIKYYDEAIDLGYSDAYVYFERGYCLYLIEQYQQSIIDFTKSLSMVTDVKEFPMRGYHLIKMGNEYIPSLMSFPLITPVQIYKFRANAKYSLDDFRGAILDFTKAISYEPKLENLFINRGNCYSRLKNYTLALADLTTAIKMNPESALAFFSRGLIKYDMGNIDDGCVDVSKSGELGHEQAYEFIQNNCK